MLSGSGLSTFRKAKTSIVEDPLQAHATIKISPTKRNILSFESSLPTLRNVRIQGNSKKTNLVDVSANKGCQLQQVNSDFMCKLPCANSSPSNDTCTEKWTDECLGLTDSHAFLSNTCLQCAGEHKSIDSAHPNQLCDMSAVDRVASDRWCLSSLEHRKSDCKRVCLECIAPSPAVSTFKQEVPRVNGDHPAGNIKYQYIYITNI